jgi:hypothetical protein
MGDQRGILGILKMEHLNVAPLLLGGRFMMTSSKPNCLAFPLWKFLNQPLFNRHIPLVLNPKRFWNLYQINFLEHCLQITYRPEEHFH